MWKHLSLLACLSLASLASTAHELTAANLQLAAIQLSPDFDYRGFVRRRLETDEPVLWALLQDDPGAMLAAIRQRAEELRLRVGRLDLKQTFVVGKTVRLRAYNRYQGGLPVAPALSGGRTTVRNLRAATNAPMPAEFTLLASNFDLLSLWPQTEEQALKFAQQRAGLPRTIRNQVYVESELLLLAYQGNRYFQTAVVRSVLYDDQNKTTILYEKNATSPVERIVSDSMLAAGITLDLAPINSLSIFGEHLLAPIDEQSLRKADCEPGSLIGVHQVWNCSSDWSLGAVVLTNRRHYVGGRLLEMAFHIQEQPVAGAIKSLRMQMSRGVALPPSASTSEPTKWRKSGVDFVFDPNALLQENRQHPFLRARPQNFDEIVPQSPPGSD